MSVKSEPEDDSLISEDESSDSSVVEPERNPEKGKHTKVKMSSSVTLGVLTKFIKSYNGDKESLPAFLTNCDNAMSLATTEQQNVLCKFILSQLEGKAQVACSLKSFTKWEDIKVFLKSTFGEKKHATHLLVDLQNCRQLPSEDVTKYSLRIEYILTKIQSDIHYNCKDPKELHGRIAAMEDLALNTFMLGLNGSISNIVRCRNPSTLNDAVQHAIEEEKLYNLKSTSSSHRSHKQCSTCNKSGHTSTECFRNKRPQSHNTQRSFHVNPAPTQNTSQGQANTNFKQCKYCKNLGHTIQECRKLKYKNQQNGNQGQASRNFPTQANVHVLQEDQGHDLNSE